MKNGSLWVFLLFLAVMTGFMFWAYQQSNNEQEYTQVFQHQYNRGQGRKKHQLKGDDPPREYHGTKESDIKKYRGDRYSTY